MLSITQETRHVGATSPDLARSILGKFSLQIWLYKFDQAVDQPKAAFLLEKY
jgi:hypothetical protein